MTLLCNFSSWLSFVNTAFDSARGAQTSFLAMSFASYKEIFTFHPLGLQRSSSIAICKRRGCYKQSSGTRDRPPDVYRFDPWALSRETRGYALLELRNMNGVVFAEHSIGDDIVNPDESWELHSRKRRKKAHSCLLFIKSQ